MLIRLTKEDMLDPYITSIVLYCCSVAPLLLLLFPCSPHIVIIVPHKSPLLLFLCPYIIIFRSARIILWPRELLYIEMRFCHLYHPRIFHSCSVLELAPLKWLISKAWISRFFSFWSWFHNIWYQSFEILGFCYSK